MVPHVLVHTDRRLEPLACRLVLCRTVVRMLPWEVHDLRAVSQEEADAFDVALIDHALEPVVVLKLRADEHVTVPARSATRNEYRLRSNRDTAKSLAQPCRDLGLELRQVVGCGARIRTLKRLVLIPRQQ